MLIQKLIRIQLKYFQDFEKKAVKAKYKFENENRQKPLIQFELFIFYETRLFNFHGRLLSIRVFSADGHHPSGYFRRTGTI